MSVLAETASLIDDLHVRGYQYERVDGDQGTRVHVTVGIASCGDYATACERLGGVKVTRVTLAGGAVRYASLGTDDVLIQHVCFPHLPCHGATR